MLSDSSSIKEIDEEVDFLEGVQVCPINLTGDDVCEACQ